MASYGALKSVHKTLTAGVGDTVFLSQTWDQIEIVHRGGAGALYFTLGFNNIVSAEGENNSFVVLPGQTYRVVAGDEDTMTVRLFSATAIPYSVVGVR